MENLKNKFLFSPTIQESFDKCLEIENEKAIPSNAAELTEMLDHFLALAKKNHENQQISRSFENSRACKLVEKCRRLIDIYDQRQSEEKLMIAASISYLVLDYDAIPDMDPFNGYDDDAQVVNAAIEAFIS